jgi:hypothetical protein
LLLHLLVAPQHSTEAMVVWKMRTEQCAEQAETAALPITQTSFQQSKQPSNQINQNEQPKQITK